ncbi:MAG: hypothetical protein NTY02_18990, partial [Acidobacteria bacterium]|nr:hypothetical protein [Acidobacteriota bacterium]
MKTPLRITWLCPYPTHDLGPFGLQVARVMSSHACSWIVNLLDALRQRDDCAVDLVTTTPTVDRRQTVVRDGVTIHVL